MTQDFDRIDTEILDPAYKLGAHIHSNSWGCGLGALFCNTYDSAARDVDRYVRSKGDILVLFAGLFDSLLTNIIPITITIENMIFKMKNVGGNDGESVNGFTQSVGSPATSKRFDLGFFSKKKS